MKKVRHNFMAACAICDKVEEKQNMMTIYASNVSCPKVLCHMCLDCYFDFLDEHGIPEPDRCRYVWKHTNEGEGS